MEGFDNSVAGGGNFALSQFRKVGRLPRASSLPKLTNIPYVISAMANGTYQVSAAWQAGLSQSANCGVIVGIFISGWLIDRYGYKRTLIGGYITIIPLIGKYLQSSSKSSYRRCPLPSSLSRELFRC